MTLTHAAFAAGYLLGVLITGRILYLTMGGKAFPVAFGIIWPLTALIFAFMGFGWGVYRLITWPTKAERIEAERKATRKAIRQLERELGSESS